MQMQKLYNAKSIDKCFKNKKPIHFSLHIYVNKNIYTYVDANNVDISFFYKRNHTFSIYLCRRKINGNDDAKHVNTIYFYKNTLTFFYIIKSPAPSYSATRISSIFLLAILGT